MSRIYFHSLEGDGIISGRERAKFKLLIDNIAYAVFDISTVDNIKNHVADQFLIEEHNEYEFRKKFRLWLNTNYSEIFLIGYKKIDPFEIILNTAYILGSDPIKLAARIHGQCEIHCFVEGKNRKWFADLISNGIKRHIYSEDVGWENVLKFLESCDSNPVVLSYSVCEQFPNPVIANFKGDVDFDGFYDLSFEDQWDKSMVGLREEHGLEIKPENWDDFYFGKGLTGFDIIKSNRIKP